MAFCSVGRGRTPSCISRSLLDAVAVTSFTELLSTTKNQVLSLIPLGLLPINHGKNDKQHSHKEVTFWNTCAPNHSALKLKRHIIMHKNVQLYVQCMQYIYRWLEMGPERYLYSYYLQSDFKA